jgi:hypothetical protein
MENADNTNAATGQFSKENKVVLVTHNPHSTECLIRYRSPKMPLERKRMNGLDEFPKIEIGLCLSPCF